MRSDLNIDYIFTSAANVEYDNTLRAHLKYLKVICNYLGISNTYASEEFEISKLNMPSFWMSIAENYFCLLGENRIELLDTLESDPVENQIVKVYNLLSVIIYSWSGSILVNSGGIGKVKIVPALYVTRLINKLK